MTARTILLSAVLTGAAAPLLGCHEDPVVAERHTTQDTTRVESSTVVLPATPAAPAAPAAAPTPLPPTPPPEPTIIVK